MILCVRGSKGARFVFKKMQARNLLDVVQRITASPVLTEVQNHSKHTIVNLTHERDARGHGFVRRETDSHVHTPAPTILPGCVRCTAWTPSITHPWLNCSQRAAMSCVAWL